MKRTVVILLLSASILMSVPFLVPHTGFVALFALVPLLCAERLSNQMKGYFWYRYLSLVLFNALTTFWVWNATAVGAILAIVLNAIQMAVVFEIARWSRKYFTGVLPYLFLTVLYLAFEKAYFAADVSWPWLTFGNAFARSTRFVQWYEYTGLLGGSLWVWLSNLAIFGLMVALSDGRWSDKWNVKAKVAAACGTILIIAGPIVLSLVMYHNYREKSETDPLEVLVLQPNIDPYNKFTALTQSQQNDLLLAQIAEKDATYDLILAPETFTSDVRVYPDSRLPENRKIHSPTLDTLSSFLRYHKPQATLLFGASAYEFVPKEAPHSHSARRLRDGWWCESRNVAIAVDRDDWEWYIKSRLVVIVEKMPWARFSRHLPESWTEQMGHCVGQKEVSLLHAGNVPFGCAVCYESVFSDYFSEYVAKGAKFMTIITNDAWWGNTPGYRQHLSFARLRAIETRRDIARSANTGISAIINQRGDIVAQTSWWTSQVLEGQINLNSQNTFYVEHGDIIGRLSYFLLALLSLALIVKVCLKRLS